VARTVRAVERALAEQVGDILVFLPGAGEIRRVEAALGEMLVELDDVGRGTPSVVSSTSRRGTTPAGGRVLPLYGSLGREAQDLALRPAPAGMRKVILATSIAETSLTIDGVSTVIDSGVMRVPRFSPRTGMNRLETVMVSRAAADQRRGRAGRQGPGTCYRLWTEIEDRGLTPHSSPEILQADLAPLALELAAWGVTEPTELRWLDPPPAGALVQARDLLLALGAITAEDRITPHGRRLAGLGLHPRLAHLLLRARELGLGALAADVAALLGERDLFRGHSDPPDADLRRRVEVLRGVRGAIPRGYTVDRGTLHRARTEARHWRTRIGVPVTREGDRPRRAGTPGDDNVRREDGVLRAGAAARKNTAALQKDTILENDDLHYIGLLLAFAFPDRIALRRQGQPGRFLLRNGRGAVLDPGQRLAEESALVAAELDDTGRESRIRLAAPLALAELQEHFADQIECEEIIAWDPELRAVRAQRRESLGALILSEAILQGPDPELVQSALLEGVAAEGLEILPWSQDTTQLHERLLFMRRLDPAWPDLSHETLLATFPEWLGPYLSGMRSEGDLRRLDLKTILEGSLTWEERRRLEEEAPATFVVPSGSRIRIDYDDPESPVLAVRLQELFGLAETPRIAKGRFPLTLHLLSPARRPVQVTRDLANFWENTYFEVRKDLRGRYPKHFWPDDPRHAPATRRTRPRRPDL
jgi:ATP-dependent helicase HrpB